MSYMCQRQSSGPMLPSEAEMPPCAATVCERVGNTLEMQAVLQARLGAADAGAQARAARADDDDVEGVVGDRIGLAAERRRALGRRSRSSPLRCPVLSLPQVKPMRSVA